MALLELRSIAKHFGAIEALKGVDLDLEPGEVLGLMGDNGAGKSTLVKVIAGNFPPSEGEIRLDGRALPLPQAGGRPRRGHRGGLPGSRAVRQPDRRRQRVSRPRDQEEGRGRSRSSTTRRMYERAALLFAELKSETRPRDLVKQMSGGQRQAVAIARTRLSDAKIVLMDEPTAAISVRQVAEVLDLIRRLRDQAIAVILISHRMPDVFAVCDRIAVLRRGRKVAEKAIADSSPEEVTGLITGAIQAA